MIAPERTAEIRAHWELARLAGIDAVDGGNGWDTAKINALLRSVLDVPDLLRENELLRAVVEAAEQVERTRTGPLSSLVAALGYLAAAVRAYRAATTI